MATESNCRMLPSMCLPLLLAAVSIVDGAEPLLRLCADAECLIRSGVDLPLAARCECQSRNDGLDQTASLCRCRVMGLDDDYPTRTG